MDYKNGKIYKITDNAYTKMYIGSTTQPLSKRFSKHKIDYKHWQEGKQRKVTSFDIFDEFGIENCKIELIEEFECENKNQLERKEGEHIKNNECVNKYVAGRTPKQYKEDNKDKIKEYLKEYNEANKDKIKEKNKEYNEANKDKIKEYRKEYNEANKDKIKEYREVNKDKIKQIINCECGLSFQKDNKARHIKSKKHQKFINV